MHAGVDHVLLTRFNLPSGGVESFVRAREGWLRSRMELFEQYCLPSVKNQTVTSFQWIIYFDPQSPKWLKDRVERLAADSPFTPIYRTQVSRQQLLLDLRDVSGAKHKNLITTNLDNDDGLAANFIQRIQQVPPVAGPTAIYLVHGLIRSGRRIYLRTDRANAFCSVIDDWDSAQTCWATWHNLLGQSMNVLKIGGDPAWLQVIHETNVSNRIRGQRTSPASYQPIFEALLDGVEIPARGVFLKDMLFDMPIREARDFGRSTVKAAAMAMVGQDGLDRLKAAWASHVSNRKHATDETVDGLARSSRPPAGKVR